MPNRNRLVSNSLRYLLPFGAVVTAVVYMPHLVQDSDDMGARNRSQHRMPES